MYKEFPLDTRYVVSKEGHVYSTRRGGMYRLTYQEDISGRYLRVCIGKKHYLLHRVIAITFIDNPDNLPQVNHKDGNTRNNNLTNLEWVTVGDNQRHAYEIGLKELPQGENNGRHVLTEKEVISIYKKLLSGENMATLSREYGVTETQIGRIKHKEAWSHILEDFPNMSRKFKSNKLKEEQVHLLCREILNKFTFKECVSKFDFSFTKDQFYDIKRGRVYKHITTLYF